jgi:hypothetical protein
MNKILILFTLLVSFLPLFAQDGTDTLKIKSIETRDGNTYIGRLLSETGDSIVLNTDKLGILRFSKTDVLVLRDLDKVSTVKGEYWLPNPQSSRYFWAPNGYGLKKGEAYYQNIWVFYNQVSVGLTDQFSIGGGLLPVFLLGAEVVPVWIVPKFSLPLKKDKINLGTGAFLGTAIGEDTGIFGLLYGTTTFGSRDKNMSIGLAYGFGGGEWMETPVINLSTMLRFSPKGYFISENYLIPVDGEVVAIVSLGGRSIIRKIGLDYSLWIPVGGGIGGFRAAPFLGISIPLR